MGNGIPDSNTGNPRRPGKALSASAGDSAAMENSSRILALETSGREGSVAALEAVGNEARLLHEIELGAGQRTAQVLAPGVRCLLDAVDWSPESVQWIAVAVGPGSFTGLRIGVTMAKTFAYAIGAQVIGVNTLTVLAEQAGDVGRPLWTVMDAQRNELFAARFADSEDASHGSDPTRIIPGADWLAALRHGDLVTGPALQKLQSKLPEGVIAVEACRWQPKASAVGIVGWREVCQGLRDDVWKLAPRYYRLSAAEEKRLAP